MQDQTVTFQAMDEAFVPWYLRLFRIYLLLVLLFAIYRTARLTWTLRRRTIPQTSNQTTFVMHPDFWHPLHAGVRSFKTLSQVTLLFSVAVLAWNLSDDALQLATQKTVGMGAVSGAAADALRTFASGVTLGAALFCLGVIFERAIQRRALRAGQKGKQQPPTTEGQ
jgi:cytochrome c biogenesis factor